ncbi:hypothetical protein D1007_42708 [Hordeum vulgare]|nr:hypothetical protein D1007_42708 [Hordeum vulgare]
MSRVPGGSWEGSIINNGHIEYLCRTRKLRSEEVVEARTPGDKLGPELRDSERVVFDSHFLVSFGLQTSSFLQHFLHSYGLQMHHLGLNSILYITCFGTLWITPFLLLPQPEARRGLLLMRLHGDLHVERPEGAKYKVQGVLQKGQWTFFYVRNIG